MNYVNLPYTFLSSLAILSNETNSCYAQYKDPIHDVAIETKKQMIGLSENPENYVGKLVKISHSWISKDDIHINNLDGVAYISFGFGKSFESLERHDDQFNFCHNQNSSGLRYTVDLGGAAMLKESLGRLELSLLRSYFKCHLFFQIQRGRTTEDLECDYNVGYLVWIKMYR
jgi:hypothetical protein